MKQLVLCHDIKTLNNYCTLLHLINGYGLKITGEVQTGVKTTIVSVIQLWMLMSVFKLKH